MVEKIVLVIVAILLGNAIRLMVEHRRDGGCYGCGGECSQCKKGTKKNQ